jgi:UDP-glucose 4-epimerase
VLDVIAKVTGLDTTPEVVARRPGDPARVVASVDRIRDAFGFAATRDLEDMVETAWVAWRATHTP